MERYKFFQESGLFFVTFSIVEWLPVFVSQAACKIITDSLIYCHDHKDLRINAFVIMPTHFHGIFFNASFDSQELESAVTDFRKFTGRNIADFCEKNMPRCFPQAFQDSSGVDRKRRVWQPSRHPVVIETEAFWETKFNYLHDNPVRKGLVTNPNDWRYSSAAYWLSDGEIQTEVPLSAIEW